MSIVVRIKAYSHFYERDASFLCPCPCLLSHLYDELHDLILRQENSANPVDHYSINNSKVITEPSWVITCLRNTIIAIITII